MRYERVIGKLLREPSGGSGDLSEAMSRVLEALAGPKCAKERAGLEAIDWAADASPFRRWLAASFRHLPLDEAVAGLWFYVPDILLNPPWTYIVGCSGFDERPNHPDWGSGVLWTQDAKARRGKLVPQSHPPEFALPALQQCQRQLRIGRTREALEAPSDAVENLAWGCGLAHVGLLVRHVVPHLPRDLLLGNRAWRGIGFGFADGDTYCAGVIGPDGWLKPGKSYRAVPRQEPHATARNRGGPPIIEMPDEFKAAAYLKAGGDPRATDDNGTTLLMAAIGNLFRRPDYKLARQLILAGHDVNAQTKSGYHAMMGLLDAPPELLKLALARGGDPNLANQAGHTPMHFAAAHENAKTLLPILAKAGGDVNRSGMHRQRPIHAAVDRPSKSTPSAVRTLAHLGADLNMKDGFGRTPLILILQNCTEFLKYSSEPNEPDSVAAARQLLDCGANPDLRMPRSYPGPFPAGGTPLMSPFYGDGSLHVSLLEHGANSLLRCPKGKTAIDYATAALSRPGKRKKGGIVRALAAMEAAADRRQRRRG